MSHQTYSLLAQISLLLHVFKNLEESAINKSRLIPQLLISKVANFTVF